MGFVCDVFSVNSDLWLKYAGLLCISMLDSFSCRCSSLLCLCRQLRVDLKREAHAEKKAFIARMMNDTQELRQSQHALNLALTEVLLDDW